MKPAWLLRLSLTVLLLFIMLWLVDLRSVLDLFRGTQWRWVFVAVILIQLQIVLSAMRWQLTALRLGLPIAVHHAIREYYLATFGNLSLPGGVTGDAFRIVRNRHAAGTAASATSVVLERMAGQLALLLIALLGWCLWPWSMSGPMSLAGDRIGQVGDGRAGVPEVSLPIPGALLVLFLLVILLLLLRRRVKDMLPDIIRRFAKQSHHVWIADRQWIRQGYLSIGVVATYLAVFACSAAALQQYLPAGGVISVVPLVLLSMVIPLSIGGWGIREAAAVSLWPLMGLSVEAAVATSVLYGVLSTVACLPGAFWAMLVVRKD